MMRLRYLVGVLLALSLSVVFAATAIAQQQTVTVAINPVGGSGVSGTATLTGMDGTTQVALNVSGFQPNTSHATHFHVGTCANPGSIVIDLPTLTADANGNASATATVNASLASLMDGNHLVQTHVTSGANFGAGIACGDVPTVLGAAAPTPAAVTPAAAAPAVAGGPAALAVAGILGALGAFALGGGLFLRR
ncbi:MAG: hypothetical protein ACM3US_09400 [Sphingomonadaceae bacterium]